MRLPRVLADNRQLLAGLSNLIKTYYPMVLVVAFICLVAVFWPHYSTSAPSDVVAEPSDVSVSEPPEPPLPPAVDLESLTNAINATVAAYPNLNVSVIVSDIKRGEKISIGQDEPTDIASIGKLVSSIAYVYFIENGTFTLDDQVGGTTARQQIQLMLQESNNPAWKLLNDYITKPKLEEYGRAVGAASYNPYDNTIRPSELANMLQALYERQIVSEEYVNFLLANLEVNREELQYIRGTVPAAYTTYHKAGWWDDRVHEVAIIELPERPVLLTIFSTTKSGIYDYEQAKVLFAALTGSVVGVFQRP